MVKIKVANVEYDLSTIPMFKGKIIKLCTGKEDSNGQLLFEGDKIVNVKTTTKTNRGKQTYFFEWEIFFGPWDCNCGDYYCNEGGIGFYVKGHDGYIREDGRIDKTDDLEKSLAGVCFEKCVVKS